MNSSSLYSNLFFLHGLSGAGKGVLQDTLTQKYTAAGYAVVAISTGDLFRAAKNEPQAREVMAAGQFPGSLAAITPALKREFTRFLELYRKSNGRAIFILDGAVRSKGNPAEGIPSQIEQLAACFAQCMTEQTIPTTEIELVDTIKQSRHLMVDVDPVDAERQIQNRVRQETEKVRQAISESQPQVGLSAILVSYLPEIIDAIAAVVDLEPSDADYETKKQRFSMVRKQVFQLAELTLLPSLLDLLELMDIHAQLRDDDVLSETRRKRISHILTGESGSYRPGPAALALEEIGIIYNRQTQRFESATSASTVIENGATKGISFIAFKQKCQELCEQLVLADCSPVNHEGVSHPPSDEIQTRGHFGPER